MFKKRTGGKYLELYVPANTKRTDWTFDAQHNVACCILDGKGRREDAPLLLNTAYQTPGWGIHVHPLKRNFRLNYF